MSAPTPRRPARTPVAVAVLAQFRTEEPQQ